MIYKECPCGNQWLLVSQSQNDKYYQCIICGKNYLIHFKHNNITEMLTLHIKDYLMFKWVMAFSNYDCDWNYGDVIPTIHNIKSNFFHDVKSNIVYPMNTLLPINISKEKLLKLVVFL